MAEQEITVINHLIEVEKNAAALVSAAQDDADKKISAAKALAESKFQERYRAIVSEKEAAYAAATAKISEKHNAAVLEYKAKIEGSAKDVPAFNALLDKLLFS